MTNRHMARSSRIRGWTSLSARRDTGKGRRRREAGGPGGPGASLRSWREGGSLLQELEVAGLLRDVDLHRVPVGELAFEDHDRQRVLDLALDQPLQGQRAEDRVEALLGEQGERGVGDLEVDPPVGEAPAELFRLEGDDPAQVLRVQRMED